MKEPREFFSITFPSSPKGGVFEATPSSAARRDEWSDQPAGQLAVDVFETDRDVIVVSTMASTVTEDIAVFIHNEVLTIRGRRLPPNATRGAKPIHTECFWGAFSRTIVLPVAVDADRARATLASGTLTIRVPKREMDRGVPIVVVEE